MLKFKTAFLNFHESHHSEIDVSLRITNTKLVRDKKYYRINWENLTSREPYASWENHFIASFLMRRKLIAPNEQNIDVDQLATINQKFTFLAFFGGEHFVIETLTTEEIYRAYESSLKKSVFSLIKGVPADGSVKTQKVRFIQDNKEETFLLLVYVHKIVYTAQELPFQTNDSEEMEEEANEGQEANEANEANEAQEDKEDKTHQLQDQPASMVDQQVEEKKPTAIEPDQSIQAHPTTHDSNKTPPILEPEVKVQQSEKMASQPASKDSKAISPLASARSAVKVEQAQNGNASIISVKSNSKMSYGLLDRLDLPKDIKEKLYFEPNLKILSHSVDQQNHWQISVRNGSMQVFSVPEAVLRELGYHSELKHYHELVDLYNHCSQE